jgi:Flp pilus assembly protein TadG
VEFALVFPIFILLLAGMIDFGLGLYSYMNVINSAREGARLGVTNCVATNCSSAVTARAQANAAGLTLDSVGVVCLTATDVGVQCANTAAGDKSSVTVTSRYTYHMIWPLAAGNTIVMTSSMKMVMD